MVKNSWAQSQLHHLNQQGILFRLQIIEFLGNTGEGQLSREFISLLGTCQFFSIIIFTIILFRFSSCLRGPLGDGGKNTIQEDCVGLLSRLLTDDDIIIELVPLVILTGVQVHVQEDGEEGFAFLFLIRGEGVKKDHVRVGRFHDLADDRGKRAKDELDGELRVVEEVEGASDEGSTEFGEDGRAEVSADLAEHGASEGGFDGGEGIANGEDTVLRLKKRNNVLRERTSSIGGFIVGANDEVGTEEALGVGSFEVSSAGDGGRSSGGGRDSSSFLVLLVLALLTSGSSLESSKELVDNLGDDDTRANANSSGVVILQDVFEDGISRSLLRSNGGTKKSVGEKAVTTSLGRGILVGEEGAQDGETVLGGSDLRSNSQDGCVELVEEVARGVTEEGEDAVVGEGVRAVVSEGGTNDLTSEFGVVVARAVLDAGLDHTGNLRGADVAREVFKDGR